MTATPDILAVDFDGVICDGLIEYFQTAWKAYCQLFPVADTDPPEGLAEPFYRLRPVVETGWEMPIVLRALLTGREEATIQQTWPALAHQILKEEGLTVVPVSAQVDGVRDHWIQTDLDHWLAQHRFYPGVIDWFQRTLTTATHLVIVTTKEERFVRQLLAQEGITLADEQVIGKAIKRPKYATLQQLIQQHPSDKPAVWFLEDRLQALRLVQQQPDLQSVHLFLADWGYNLAADRQAAQADPGIQVISLETLHQPLEVWLPGSRG